MFTPQFLITPYEVKVCPGLRPSDGDVYAIVYWFEHLKDGKCTAANETIAEILGIDGRTVRACLDRLERKGFIERVYEDPDTRKIRKEIKSLLVFEKKASSQAVFKVKSRRVKAKDLAAMEPGGVIQISAEETEEVEESPGEYAKRFFDPKTRARVEFVDELCAERPEINREAVIAELKKFFVYWTEPNKSGTKQKWQLERTFEVKRRLYTWLSRAGQYAGSAAGKQRAGAGTTL